MYTKKDIQARLGTETRAIIDQNVMTKDIIRKGIMRMIGTTRETETNTGKESEGR